MKILKFASLSIILPILIFFLFWRVHDFPSTTGVAQAFVTPTPRRVFWGGGSELAPELTYRFLFDEIAVLMWEDEQQPKKTAFKASFYEERLGLKPEQFARLDDIVSQYIEQTHTLDERARQIINEYRAQFPNAELPKPKPTPPVKKRFGGIDWGEKQFEGPPVPPAELVELQARKNKLVLEMKEKLKKSLGDAEFTKFEVAVRRNADAIMEPESGHKPETLQPVLGN